MRGARPGKNVQLTEGEIKGLCLKSREIFLSQPILLELEAPLKICGKSRFFRVDKAKIRTGRKVACFSRGGSGRRLALVFVVLRVFVCLRGRSSFVLIVERFWIPTGEEI